MNNDDINADIRAVLEKMIQLEVSKIKPSMDEEDERLHRKIEMMQPVIDAFIGIPKDLLDEAGISVSATPGNLGASIRDFGTYSSCSYFFTTTIDGSAYEVERHESYSFDGEGGQDTSVKTYDSPDKLIEIGLRMIAEKAGKKRAKEK